MSETGTPSDPRPTPAPVAGAGTFGLCVAAAACAAYARRSQFASCRSAGDGCAARCSTMSIRCIRPTARTGPEKHRIVEWISSRCTPAANPSQPLSMSTRQRPPDAGSGTGRAPADRDGRRSRRHPRVHTVGRVTPDEALTYRVSAGVDGWVRRVFSDRTGTSVKRGDALAAIFSKDISAPQQAYVYALESYEQLKRAAIASGRCAGPRHAATGHVARQPPVPRDGRGADRGARSHPA